MASRFSFFFLLLCVFFISQFSDTNCTSDISELLKDPAVHVFFKIEDLKVGNKIPAYFKPKSPYKKHFLPKEKADSIPFSSKRLPQLLNLFSFPNNSKQALEMAVTLKVCERKPSPGEIKFCLTSLESLIESVRGVLGSESHIHVLTTKLSPKHRIKLQNYTVLEEPKALKAHKQIGCHIMPYPYRVYFCHTQVKPHLVFKIPLVGDDGERIEAVGACHRDTASFTPDDEVFQMLKTKPGATVCHVMQAQEYFFYVL